jgi:hypothetical protein
MSASVHRFSEKQAGGVLDASVNRNSFELPVVISE